MVLAGLAAAGREDQMRVAISLESVINVSNLVHTPHTEGEIEL